MIDVYLIKGKTLTAIADAIREIIPNDYPEGSTITPEEMGNTAIYSVYNQGYADGKEDGGVDLEALGELCEVVTMVDSAEELYVAIFNRHPTYYLHCTFNHTNLGSINVVVSPNGMESYTVWNIYKEFYIDNVRWKASAT